MPLLDKRYLNANPFVVSTNYYPRTGKRYGGRDGIFRLEQDGAT
jgi:hypothetical protein